jgi:hypothetical protein
VFDFALSIIPGYSPPFEGGGKAMRVAEVVIIKNAL